MHRIDGPGATEDNKFTKGDPTTGVPATQVTPEWLNAVQEELMAILAKAGISPDKNDNAQIVEALRLLGVSGKANDEATRDPGPSDDSTAGYSVGSRWINVSNGEVFRCLDDTPGSADWVKTTLTLDELGSAATRNVGGSPGNVMEVGAFGLGSNATALTDCNAVNLSGFYYADGSAVNTPIGTGGNWLILHMARTASIGTQIAVSRSTGSANDIYVRKRDSNGTWSDWVECWHSGNQIDLGITPTSARNKLGFRGFVSLTGDFGAVGNGTADDTDAVTAFFSHLATNGGIGIIPPGTYKTTAGISFSPSKPFRVIGAGKGASIIKLSASSDTTLLAVIGPTDSVVSDIGLDCGYSETGFASHGISVSNPRGMIFERCHVSDYKNSAGLMFASTLDTYGQSHFIDCTADGNGAANNGFLLVDLLDSTIDNCDVENLAAAGSPGYGLQLKNKCVRSKIIGGSARGCRGGYVLASDGAEGPIGCQIIGGNASGSYEGLVVGKSTDCNVMGLDIDMDNNAAAGYAVNIGAGNSGNVIDVTVRNVAATKTAIRVGSDNQTIILRHGSGVGAKMLELTSGVDNCRTFVMDLTDTFTSILDLVQDDSGTATNEILLMSNLLSGGLSGNSFLRAPTPGKPNNWISFVGSQDGVNVRTNGVDRVTIRPTYHAPGADNTMSSARAGARWSEVFAATGTINTSDAREKTDIGAIPDEWLDAWADVQYSRFKFIDAVTKKGDGARWHVGVVAQQVRDAFAAHGLDALEIGLLCYDEWGDEYDTEGNLVIPAGNRWGIRADECQFMEIALMRRELSRLKTIG